MFKFKDLKEVEKKYIAYLEKGEDKGYLEVESGQGEELLFLTGNITDATEYYTKEYLLKDINNSEYKDYKIRIAEIKTESITSFKEIAL